MPDLSSKNELLTEILKTVNALVNLFSSLDNNQINLVPYPGSWTAGQLLRHVTKSTAGMANVMQMQSKPAERDPAFRINELKATFLDFTSKLQSPEFIIPEEENYNKEASIAALRNSFGQLTVNAEDVNLNDLVTGLPLGDITKLEMLHFVLYHTQRHVQQLKKICAGLD